MPTKIRDSFGDVLVFILGVCVLAALTVGIVVGTKVTSAGFDREMTALADKLIGANARIGELEGALEEKQGEGVFVVRVIEGRASYYGKESGTITSIGEPFDGTSWTAAHRTLPPGTLLVVESIDTGRWAVVRINDFGPARRLKDREIDLSRRVAEHLGIVKQGLARVRLYELGLRPKLSGGD